MANLIGIGVSGLVSSQAALTTTGNNITNANVAGYSRQRVNLVTQPEQYLGVGYVGSGAKVDSITRVVEQYTINQLWASTANYNDVSTQSAQYDQLDSLLADTSTGVTPSLQQLFGDLQQASQDPQSIPVRQVVLSDLTSLTQRFNSLYDQLQAQNSTINQQLTSLTSQVTSLAQGIAQLNQQIAGESFGNAQPNALLDKRDELVRQMSELVSVQVIPQDDGSINLMVGNGQPLVVGNRANALSTAPSADDPSRLQVVFQGSGTSQEIGQFISGGKIGGLLAFRKNSLDKAFNTLGQVAINVADALNQQQRLGLDLNGAFGTNLFTDINTTAAMQARVIPAGNNPSPTQTMAVYIDNASALTNSDYSLQFTSATGYTLTRLSDGTQTTGTLTLPLPASIASADGFQIQISSGTFQAGDRFTIQPTRQGAANIGVALQSPQGLALAQPISTAASLNNTGGGTISAGQMIAAYQADGVTLQSTFATAGSLTPPLLVRFISPTTYDVLDNTNPAAPVAIAGMTGLTFTPGQDNPVTINDPVTGDPVYSFNLAGNPATGDTFTVGYNANGSSDNRNALALAGLQQTDVIGGRSTFEDVYGQLVTDIGANAAQLKINSDAADTLLTQAQANRDAISGVNLDEEAANLIQFQQAYNASAQVISVARSLFDTLLQAFR